MKRATRILLLSTLFVCAASARPALAEPTTKHDSPLVAVSASTAKFYPKARDLQHALRSGTADIEFEALRELASSETGTRPDVTIEPFEGTIITLDGNSLFVNNSATIVGRLKDGESGVFILSWAGINMYGMLEAGLTRFLFETDLEDPWGTIRVKEVDQASFPGCGTEPGEGDEGGPGDWQKKRAWATKSQPANHTVIETMILYTTDMANNHSGDPAAFANTLSASITAAMSGSSVTGSSEIVAYKPTSYAEPSYPFAFNDFNGAMLAMQAGNASPFASIEADQDSYRADVVVMLVDGTNVDDDPPFWAAVCGVGFVTSVADDEAAYAVVQDQCAAGDLTYAHEVTHLLGGRHDWGPLGGAGATDPTSGWLPGFGHGYTHSSPDFRTVMGGRTNCSYAGGCARLSRYSDLNQVVNISGTNYALGVLDDWATDPKAENNKTDMVATLANSVPAVALYRQSGDSAPGQPSSLTVDRLCSGNNELTWTTPSGTTGWYEVEASSSSSYTSPTQEYRGGQNSVIIHVSGTKYVRVRACNAEGCGSYRNGNLTATVACP